MIKAGKVALAAMASIAKISASGRGSVHTKTSAPGDASLTAVTPAGSQGHGAGVVVVAAGVGLVVGAAAFLVKHRNKNNAMLDASESPYPSTNTCENVNKGTESATNYVRTDTSDNVAVL